MKKAFLTFSSVVLTVAAYAQQNPTEVKYAQIISADLAKKHLSIIASDAYEGRETGKPGADKAAHYIADEFKSLGLQPIVNGSYFLDVPLVESTLTTTCTVNGHVFDRSKDFSPGRGADDKTITASDVVYVGYGTDTELAGLDLKDKVVLWINEDKPQEGVKPNTSFRMSPARMKIIGNILTKGPALIFAVNTEAAAAIKRNFATAGSSIAIKDPANKPKAAGTGIILITPEMADEFTKSTGKTFADLKATAATGAAGQTLKAEVKMTFHNDYKDVKAVDVLGYLPGSDPKLKDETLVISAHYDHIGILPEGTPGDRVNNGADDDGSGTTGIMEIARAFSKAKKDGHGPRRSILFLGNVGEEKGLLGSEYYTDHPVIPLANTIADLNIDMIGRVGHEYLKKPDSANYVYVIGSAMLSSDLHKVSENANSTYTKLDLDYKYDDPNDPNKFYYRSDHYNFAKHGVPIIFYFNGVHDDYHRPGDEVSKINFPLLAKRAQLVFYTAWDLLNAENRPVVDAKK